MRSACPWWRWAARACSRDLRRAVDAGASAVAAGSLFVFHGPHRAVLISYPGYTALGEIFGG